MKRTRSYDLPPQPRLEIPLLWALIRRGGRVFVRHSGCEIKQELADLFNLPLDKQLEFTTDGKDNRWWNTLRFVRETLRTKGDLDGRIHGVWQVTDKGRLRVAEYLSDCVRLVALGSWRTSRGSESCHNLITQALKEQINR